jgi:hypothetical protein
MTKVPDSILSIPKPLEDVRITAYMPRITLIIAIVRYKYTLRYLDMDGWYQRYVVRSKLTRNIAATFDPA